MRVSISGLKDHLSGYLKKVQLGEEVIITFHEKPLAKIIPFTNHDFSKINRSEWIKKIKKSHLLLGKLKIKEPVSKMILRKRKEERY